MTTATFKTGDLVKYNLIDGSAAEVFRVIWVLGNLVHVQQLRTNGEPANRFRSFSWRAEHFTPVN